MATLIKKGTLVTAHDSFEADLLIEGAPADVPLHHVGELLRRALLVQPGVGQLGAGAHAGVALATGTLNVWHQISTVHSPLPTSMSAGTL